MNFTQVLNSEWKWIIESIEHGCSDNSVIENLKTILFEKTGYKWVD